MEKLEVQKILQVYEGLDKGRYILGGDDLDEAYSYLPSNILVEPTLQAKMLAIRRFVILNQDIINETLNRPDTKQLDITPPEVVIPTPNKKVITIDRMAIAREAKKNKTKLNIDKK
jgi:hypothetical protein